MNGGALIEPEDLEEILRRAGDAITVQAPDGHLLFANRAAAELMGFTSEAELLATPMVDLLVRFEMRDEEGRPLAPEALPGRRVMLGEAAPEAVIRFRRAGGGDRWSLVRATPVVRDGSLRYVINAFQDITELKRREIALELLADAGRVLGRSTEYQETLRELAYLVVPELADWCVVDVFEPSGLRRVAVAHSDPAKVAMAEDLQRRYPPAPDEPSPIGDVLRTGEPVIISRVIDEMLAGAARDAEHLAALTAIGMHSVLIMPLAARGNVVGAMTLVTAESAREYGESDLPLLRELAGRAGIAVDNARLLHDATEAVRLRDDFLATASHDMRTPIATILGYLQIAQRHLGRVADPGRLPDYLDRAERTTVRLVRLVAELMDVSLIRAGQQLPLALRSIDVGEIVARSIQEHRLLNETHRILMDRPSEPVEAVTDDSRLLRILDNVVGNAIKYSEAGTTVDVRVTPAEDDVLIAVTDQGVGIPPDELPVIFERYRRASTAMGAPGVGLGLSGSREVARQMGGDLYAESIPGDGSTFTLRIPRRPPPGVAEAEEA